MSETPLCSLCSKSPACSFCTCTHAETFICSSCFQAHFSKFPIRVHQSYPLQALDHYKKPGYVEKLHARIEALEHGKEAVARNIGEIDDCIATFKEKIEQSIKAIREFEERKVAGLMKLKSELEEMAQKGIEEVEKTIYDDETDFTSDIAVLLRENQLEKDAKIFEYNFEDPSHNIECTVLMNYTLCGTRGATVPNITGRILKVYNPADESTLAATLPQAINSRAALCFVDNDSVMCIGGSDPCTATAYLLNLSNREVTQEESMTAARDLPGVIKTGTFVYVFGGFDETGNSTTSCERFSLVRKSWEEMPEMTSPKAAFWPCALAGRVYLPYPGQQLEIFDLQSQTFDAIDVTFDVQDFDALKDGVVSIVIDREIVILSSDGQCTRLQIDGGYKSLVSTMEMESVCGCVSVAQPIHVGRNIYWVDFSSSSVIRFDFDSEEVCVEELLNVIETQEEDEASEENEVFGGNEISGESEENQEEIQE